jgi:glycerophosphoryl diester phosphodiesterase
MRQRWLRVAHRGASGSAPEHTRPAFERALRLGVDMIELDVQLSRDGELVVIHDAELNRTTNGVGAVRDRLFAELKELDAGGWYGPQFAGEHVLSLDEVIDIVGADARLNVEVKAPQLDWPILATRLIGTLRNRGRLEPTIVSCFEPGALAVIHEQDAGVRLGLLWQRTDFEEAWDWARRLGALSIHPHWMLVSSAVVNAAHSRGLQVLTWTANEIPIMRELVHAGVDGIISDHPERFASVGA